jgi:hypothetical protein
MSVNAMNDIGQAPKYARLQMLQDEQTRRQIRANASLPENAWRGIEDAVYPAMDDVLTIVDDLRDRGLTVDENVQNKIANWHKQDYQASASISMEPETDTSGDNAVDYDLDGSPMPLIHSDFSIGFRESGTDGPAGAGMAGQDLETLNAEGSARAVAEAVERLTLYGWEPTIRGENPGSVVDGFTMYGLTNHPNTHTGTLGNWIENPEVIRKNLKDDMARDIKDDNFRPTGDGYLVYVGEDLEDVLEDPDPEGTGDRLIRDRINNLDFVDEIKTSDYLQSDAALMFRPTSDVIDLAIGLEEQVVQWEDPFRDYFKTVMCMTPRVKDTLRGQCGISYYTGGTS